MTRLHVSSVKFSSLPDRFPHYFYYYSLKICNRMNEKTFLNIKRLVISILFHQLTSQRIAIARQTGTVVFQYSIAARLHFSRARDVEVWWLLSSGADSVAQLNACSYIFTWSESKKNKLSHGGSAKKFRSFCQKI